MKPKSTLRTFLAIAGSSLFAITCASATTYYWDGNDGAAGFQDADPGPAGTWSASTPSTATGGFTTDSTGSTAISTNPAVATTINDDIFFGTGSSTDLAPLYPFTGAITIDGTVNAKSITCSANHPAFVAGTSPVINFPAEGRFEHATEGTITLPAITLTGATTSMTWKAGFIDNLVIDNVINNAAKNIFEGTGSFIAIKGGPELGPAGTPIVLNGGGFRLSSGFPYSSMSAFNAVYPITVNPNVSFGLAPFGFAFTLDTTLGLGTGGLYIAGQNASSPVIITAPQTHTGGTFMVSSIAEISDNAQLGAITSPLVFGSGPSGTGEGANGMLRITGTTMTSLGARPLVHTPDKGVSFDIADAANIFTLDQPLNQGTGGFTKSGAGGFIINTSSNYTGTTTVSGGSLTFQGNHSIGGVTIAATASALNFATGSSISLTTGSVSLASGAGSGGRGFAVNGSVTSSLASSVSIGGRSSISINNGGSWNMQGGTLTVRPQNSGYTASLNVNSGGTFTYSGADPIIVAESTSNNTGSGNLILRGTFNTTTGFINTGAGSSASASSNFNFDGGTLKISNDIASLFASAGQPFNVALLAGGGTIDTNSFNTATALAITGAGGLTKAGGGTLTLSGTNTYAGDTTVTGGTLVLAADNINNDASRVAISGTGVLKLDNTTSDTVQKLIVNGNRMPNGTYGYNTADSIAQGINSSFDATGTGTLTVTDNVAPTLAAANIVDDKSGGPVTANTLVTYTVTFSEEMDASTISAADFGNAGDATCTIGTVTQVSPSVFQVPVTPTSAGTLQLSVLAGADIRDFVNNALNTTSAIADVDILTVNAATAGYASWSGGAPADGDANNDGVKNGVAWALGAADPAANAIGLLPTLNNTSDPNYLIYTFQRSDLANTDPNTTITVEYGNNLTGWTTAVDDNNNVEIEETDGSPKDTVVVKLKRSTLGASGKLFVRLNVAVTTP